MTYLIPVRIDSPERLENLELVVNWVGKDNVFVAEFDTESKVRIEGIRYMFCYDDHVWTCWQLSVHSENSRPAS